MGPNAECFDLGSNRGCSIMGTKCIMFWCRN
jgi:hypothetical protein